MPLAIIFFINTILRQTQINLSKMELSKYIQNITEPQTILMAKKSRELKAEGKQVVDLSIGEPDFATPDHIKEAAKVALDEGYTKYPPVAGYPELKDAICTKLKRDNQLNYDPNQIVVSTGAKQALANVFACLINEGDEVLIPTPYWVTYASQVEMYGGVCIYIPCSIEENFKLTSEKLSAAITSKTKLLVYSSPCNPSGAVYSEDELKALAEVLIQHPQIMVVSDEIYEYINFIGAHNSMAQQAGMQDRTIIINGFSKGYAMTGWRLGYMAGPSKLAAACEKMQAQITSGANSIAQRAAITALTGTMRPTKEMVAAFEERRNYFVAALDAIDGIQLNMPEGAFYAFANISSFFGKKADGKELKDSMDFCLFLLNEGLVTGVSGDAFGEPNCIRFSFATSMDQLRQAIVNIKAALAKLS